MGAAKIFRRRKESTIRRTAITGNAEESKGLLTCPHDVSVVTFLDRRPPPEAPATIRLAGGKSSATFASW